MKTNRKRAFKPTPRNCPACKEKRMHAEHEWDHHPQAGTGTPLEFKSVRKGKE